MKYTVKNIPFLTEIDKCPLIPIQQALWDTTYTPKSYGQLALLDNYGFLVKLICEEKNPLTTYTQFNDPVFLDSAVEFFFQPFLDCPEYINFELNANGALLAQIGIGRSQRKNISPALLSLCTIQAEKKETQWSIFLYIPYSFLQEMYPFPASRFKEMDTFRFNLYKISESKNCTHFLSTTFIDSPVPNFHLPEFFATAVIRS